jgi:hypothetical protein
MLGGVLNCESFSTFQDPSDNYRFFEFLDVWNWLMIVLKYDTCPTLLVPILSQVSSLQWTPPTNSSSSSSSCVCTLQCNVHKSWLISSAHFVHDKVQSDWLIILPSCFVCQKVVGSKKPICILLPQKSSTESTATDESTLLFCLQARMLHDINIAAVVAELLFCVHCCYSCCISI